MKKRIVLFMLMVLSASTFTGCSDADDSYRDTLNSGLNKYYSGQEMSKSEYNAVKSYNNWKSKQGTKTYSDWDN